MPGMNKVRTLTIDKCVTPSGVGVVESDEKICGLMDGMKFGMVETSVRKLAKHIGVPSGTILNSMAREVCQSRRIRRKDGTNRFLYGSLETIAALGRGHRHD